MKYWLDETLSKEPATRKLYLRNFTKFSQWLNKTPDEILEQRQKNLRSTDPKIQRTIESYLIKFLADQKKEGYAPATLQVVFASVRSFFEIHYVPLRMRRGDYPKGESLGVRRANKKAILKAVENKRNRNKISLKAMILFLKDSGLRVSDARLLNYGDIQIPLERGDEIIPITMITQKSKIVAKTFIGKEAIDALKEYLKARRKGNRRIPPEPITAKSPLFRTWIGKEVKRIPRESFCSNVRQAFLRIGEANVSAHSLRKFLQTNLEVAGVNVNWIDQMLGHRLINSRDAYSKPTDEQLKEAYAKAYPQIKVYPEIIEKTEPTPEPQAKPQPISEPTENEYLVKIANNITEATQLIAQGYEYAAEIDGTKLFKKRK